jgi:hypothetical protein
VLDLLAGLEGPGEAHLAVHVPDDRDPGLGGGCDGRVVDRPRDEVRELDEVVAGVRQLEHGGARLVGRRHDAAVERIAVRLPRELRARQVKRGAQHLAGRDALAQGEVLRGPDHQARRRDAVRDHHRELVGGERIGPRAVAEEVRVHVGEPRHQPPSPAVDAEGVVRHLDRRRVAHHDDPPVADEHRLVLDHPLTVHRDHGDVGEGHRAAGLRVPGPDRPRRLAGEVRGRGGDQRRGGDAAGRGGGERDPDGAPGQGSEAHRWLLGLRRVRQASLGRVRGSTEPSRSARTRRSASPTWREAGARPPFVTDEGTDRTVGC